MKSKILPIFRHLLLLAAFPAMTFAQSKYHSLDSSAPILFKGKYIVYKGDTIHLGEKAFFVDGQLTDVEAHKYPHVFNSIREALSRATAGTEQQPMTLYIAPYVYWIDDPEDPKIREVDGKQPPFGMEVNCPWLRFYGLNPDARNVVLASNRGQTIGARGNFTMFHLLGDGISAENITFGNYCNVDLEFPLKPVLNRAKRASAIVQAQLIICNGDKIVARNTRFISRLNLCPFVGGKRILFDRCHFESTDDALCGSGVYLNSTFDFYSSKPFYNTTGTGAVFLNCDIHSFTRGEQFLTKAGGQMAIVDSRFSGNGVTYIGWQDIPGKQTRNYQSNVSLNDKKTVIGANDRCSTIDMENKPLLNAYRLIRNGETIYNTYNLLRGNDDWDPMGIKGIVTSAERETNLNLSNLPTRLLLSVKSADLETGKDTLALKATLFRFGNYKMNPVNVKWKIESGDESLVKLQSDEDGNCIVKPTNQTDETRQLIITAYTEEGLEAACEVNVAPAYLEAPGFHSKPTLKLQNGKIILRYKLNTSYEDESVVKWYRCSDANGNNPVLTAVSRMNKPLIEYPLESGDAGYYIMASVSPKHKRCKAGKAFTVVTKKQINSGDVATDPNHFSTDFRNVPTENQHRIIPGFWTLTHFKGGEATDTTTNAWKYGRGEDGAVNDTGLFPTGRSASLYYTPVNNKAQSMQVRLTVAPFKSAGQGFSVAYLYMDILIKYDATTQSGYGLRILRTTKYSNAVDCFFVRYQDGKVTELTAPVSISCFRTPCFIDLKYTEGEFSAHAYTTSKYENNYPVEVLPELKISTKAENLSAGGFGINFNGGAAVLIKELDVQTTSQNTK